MAYPQGPSAAPPRKPSKTGIIWAIAIFVVTAVIGIAMIVVAIGTIAGAIDDLQEVDAGQTRQLTLTPGDQYVFVGARSEAALSDVSVVIEDPSGNRLRPTSSGQTYDANNSGEVFKSIGYIDVNSTGTYSVTVDGPAGSSVRIGEIPIGRFVGLLLGGIAIGGVGFVVALVILIVALVRRSRVKKQNRLAAGGYPSGGYPPAGYGAPPAYGASQPPTGYGQPPAPGFGAPPPSMPPPPAPPTATPPPPAPSTPPPPPPGQGTPPPPPPPGSANQA